jgi:hypothetical protein
MKIYNIVSQLDLLDKFFSDASQKYLRKAYNKKQKVHITIDSTKIKICWFWKK